MHAPISDPNGKGDEIGDGKGDGKPGSPEFPEAALHGSRHGAWAPLASL